MKLRVAVRVKKHQVFVPICTSFASPDHMMAVPSRDFCDSLVAHRTETFLFLPQMQESSFAGQVPLGFHIETLLKIRFPVRIERIGRSLNGSMPLDFDIDRSP